MSEENGTTTEQPEQVNEAQEATAAAAAFANARSDEPVITPEPQPEVVAEPEPAPEPKRFANRTEEEIEVLLGEIPSMKEGYRKQIDNLAGNVGALKSALQRLQQDTPKGEAVTVTDEDLAEMSEQFPELAGTTKNVLNNVLKRMNFRGGAPIDPAEIDQRVSKLVGERVSNERVAIHLELLDGLNPGWRDVVGMPDKETHEIPDTEYRKWLRTQPAEYQHKMLNTNNAFEIGNSIKAFQQASDAAAKKQSQNKQRLANAVQPASGQSAPRSALSEQQAADAAFTKSRGR